MQIVCGSLSHWTMRRPDHHHRRLLAASCLLFFFFSFKEISAEETKSFRGPFHLLVDCNRRLTFLTSVAVGAFVTKIIKESPLTPLPLPPLSESLHWNFVSLPAHMPLPFMRWTQRHPQARPVYLNQGLGGLVDGGILRRSFDDIFTSRSRFPRNIIDHVSRISYPVWDAAQRTLKPLKYIIPHAIGIKHLLHRLCG